jgi:hypothetical protein
VGEEAYEEQDRREHPRYDMVFPVEMEVAIPGSKPLRLKGTTINVSLGGVLVDLPQTVHTGARCRVHFQHAVGRISPSKQLGQIRHVRPWKQGRHAVAVEFREPLEMVKAAGQL